MNSGIIPVTKIPGWPVPVAGVVETIPSPAHVAPDGLHADDIQGVQSHLDSYIGSAIELEWNRTRLQTQLDTNLNNNFNLIAFIRAGTISTLTGTNVANFLANSTNNYRSLRNQIATATTVVQLQAININAGWPSNP